MQTISHGLKGLFLLSMLLVSSRSFAVDFDASKKLRNTSTIKWVYVNDIAKACNDLYRKYNAKPPNLMDACSEWAGGKCTIYTKIRPTEADVGHEVMHCFQEHFHQ